ncbi:TadE/TadG family type IV pilus assembly protein [Paenarthrobacter sp. NPDC089714]|uniref:TadE/TadG family type IV pilus assembly protein n=1 Tax=Paenarthrobacter sp. NPDC089714 TaxID=3364377 RepID=UPI003803DE9C
MVDFVLVGSVMTALFVAVVQLMLVLHVRNTLIDAAASGARYGAMADRTAADAEERTTELITVALNERFAEDITTAVVEAGGIRTLEVRVTAPLPVVGLLGAGGSLKVVGHAVVP